jgi:uncharacterized lipoprotein YbaY
VSSIPAATTPSNGTVVVEIYDTNLPDADTPVIASQELGTSGITTPIPFSIDYDPTRFTESWEYSLLVRILDEAGEVVYASMFPIQVIMNGAPTADLTIPVVARDR